MPLQSTERLIKANSLPPRSPGATFRYEDLSRRCDELVRRAHDCADELRARAESEAREVHQHAADEGYSIGHAAGIAAAGDEIAARVAELAAAKTQEQLQHVLPAVAEAVAAIDRERDLWLDNWEQSALRLSLAIAERLVRRELASRPELAGDIVREALQLAATAPTVRLRMHPDTIADLGACGGDVLDNLRRVSHAELAPDPAISRHGCIVETRQGTIDARLETQLDRIAAELLPTE